MKSREFEILNEKLNSLFEEIMWLRHDFQKEMHEKKIKELEYKTENAKENLERMREERRYLAERIDDCRNHFRNIDNMFPKEVIEELE